MFVCRRITQRVLQSYPQHRSFVRLSPILLQQFNDRQGRRIRYNDSDEDYRDGYIPNRLSDMVELSSRLKKYDWTDFTLPSIIKDVYRPLTKTLERSDEEISQFRSENRITVEMKGSSVVCDSGDLKPTLELDEPGFPEDISVKLQRFGFEKPTAIQAQGWPIALRGFDMIGIGETGSGKTLGYLLPGLVHIEHQPDREMPDDGPVVLVIAPTRELAQQIHGVTRKFSKRNSACLVGGSHKSAQLRDLSYGADIVIATPGRLIDLLGDEATNLRRCSYVVLDEADRMLDMGFEPQIRSILSQVRPGKQLLMWSATWPNEVRDLAKDFFGRDSSYCHVNIGSSELQANKMISQSVDVVWSRDKNTKLIKYLESLEDSERKRILIFAETKRRVDMLVSRLKFIGCRVMGIHGNKSQAFRTSALQNFRNGSIDILVATSVASRGLDVNDIRVVINFDFPNQIEDYVHRIGRTGRNKKSGKSYTLFDPETDGSQVKDLIRILEEADQDVNPELREVFDQQRKYFRRKSFKNR